MSATDVEASLWTAPLLCYKAAAVGDVPIASGDMPESRADFVRMEGADPAPTCHPERSSWISALAGMRGVCGRAIGTRSGAWRNGIAAFATSTLLAACGGTGSYFSGSPLDLFNTSSKATTANAAAPQGPEVDTDVPCPDVQIRHGAATLVIGKNPKDQQPSPLEVRYQGSIIRTARECHVAAGTMTMKVGIEGRIITGPAGGPGTVEVPLRVAVVENVIPPKTIVSNFGKETVTIGQAVDRVTFTHIDGNIVFPLPQPLGLIDSYVVYVGFDPAGSAPEKKRVPARKRAHTAAVPR